MKITDPVKDILVELSLLSPHPFPAAPLVGHLGTDGMTGTLRSLDKSGVVVFDEGHPIWGAALTQGSALTSVLGAVGGFADAARQIALVAKSVGFFLRFFDWPPVAMRQNAKLLEPHLDEIAGLAKRNQEWQFCAQLQHHRAGFLRWEGATRNALVCQLDAVSAFKKVPGAADGVMALLLCALGDYQFEIGKKAEALASVLEAERLFAEQSGENSLDLFLICCQVQAVARGAGAMAEAERAGGRALGIAELMGRRNELEKHLTDGTLTWPQWQLQRFKDFD